MNGPMLLDAAMPTPTESLMDFIMDNPVVVVVLGVVLVAAIVLVISIMKNNDKK
ncbi:MAG: hypothetical protein IKR23_06485 [Lachnospiraceae bacterium]|nr:hypothetical protein [Lachnospiraceae bacterium]